MKVLLFGYGSIGQRHAANLKTLRPEVEIVIFDPPKGYLADIGAGYDAAIIASPTHLHHDCVMVIRSFEFKHIYIEKPYTTVEYYKSVPQWSNEVDKATMGYQYRFHAAMPAIREEAIKYKVIAFHAYDDLVGRYGPDVDGVMAAHSIDAALWIFGPAIHVDIVSNGVKSEGYISHERGVSYHYHYMNKPPRRSWVDVRSIHDLPANNEMYLDALRAWLEWVEGGERDERTATLADGLAVMQVLAQVKHV